MEKHIGALDGIRAYAILIVVWYHLWQQNWLTPYVNFNNTLTKYIGIRTIPLDVFVRYGFAAVDIVVLLSAFCNFYPYMRSVFWGEEWPDTKAFLLKRAARILPSYYLAVLVTFFVSLLRGNYGGERTSFIIWDLLSHLFFVSGFFPKTFISSSITPVLWTVEMEILFYLIMPFLAKQFKKHPLITYFGMLLVSVISTNFLLYNRSEVLRGFVNFPLTFFCVYANGLMACTLYILLRKDIECNIYVQIASTVISVGAIAVFSYLLHQIPAGDGLSYAQLSLRIPMSFANAAFVLSTPFSFPLYQKIFDNRPIRWLCSISYNMYLWNLFIFSYMVFWHIPYYSGQDNPAWSGDRIWQWKYTILAIINLLLISAAVTYFYERPIRTYLISKFETKKG